MKHTSTPPPGWKVLFTRKDHYSDEQKALAAQMFLKTPGWAELACRAELDFVIREPPVDVATPELAYTVEIEHTGNGWVVLSTAYYEPRAS
jgi:hypothetical protein